jgi:ketosteroid isomerase-like protein
MSHENVEIVRRYIEAVYRVLQAYWKDPRSAKERLNAGELAPEGVELASFVHPNVQWKTALTGVTYRGYVGISKGFDQLVEAAQDYRVVLKDAEDLAEHQVLAVVEVSMKGKSSDIDVDATIFSVVTVRDGLITRMDEYLERADAFEAAGLRE